MGYRIKKKEEVVKAVRRIVREQLRSAIRVARDRKRDQEERVHEVRTRLKRSRAALALIRARGPGARPKRDDRRLRDAGRLLARPRDLAVQAHTFRVLGTRLQSELPPRLLVRLSAAERQIRRALEPKEVERDLKRAARALRRLRRDLSDWGVGSGRRAIGKGVTRTYRSGLAKLEAARERPTPDRFHDWRKQVKALSYELRIIAAAVPELTTTLMPKIDRLGEILGQVHDLDCVKATAGFASALVRPRGRRRGGAGRRRPAAGRAGERGPGPGRERVRGAGARRARAGRDRLEDLAQGAARRYERSRKRTADSAPCRRAGKVPVSPPAWSPVRSVACARVAGVSKRAPKAQEADRSPQPIGYRDGHARPRALAFNWDDGLLYVALSTADQVAVVDPSSSPPRLLTKVDACRFPDAIAALPKGGALVGCRFDPGLVRITGDAAGGFRASRLAAGLPAGARGLVVPATGRRPTSRRRLCAGSRSWRSTTVGCCRRSRREFRRARCAWCRRAAGPEVTARSWW